MIVCSSWIHTHFALTTPSNRYVNDHHEPNQGLILLVWRSAIEVPWLCGGLAASSRCALLQRSLVQECKSFKGRIMFPGKNRGGARSATLKILVYIYSGSWLQSTRYVTVPPWGDRPTWGSRECYQKPAEHRDPLKDRRDGHIGYPR